MRTDQYKSKPVKHHWRPPAFNVRDIARLKKPSTWDAADLAHQLRCNRLLSPDALLVEPEQLLADARVLHSDWLTDIAPLSATAALTITLAARLVCDYRVTTSELNDTTQCLITQLQSIIPSLFDRLNDTANQQMDDLSDELVIRIREKFIAKYPGHDDKRLSAEQERVIAALSRVEYGQAFNQQLTRAINEILDDHLDVITAEVGISRKVQSAAQSDLVVSGAAGSGKSSIVRLILEGDDQLNYASVVTDDYRGVMLPGNKDSALQQRERYIASQDMAYLIKCAVIQRLTAQKHHRATMVIDGIILESQMLKLLDSDARVAIACLPDVSKAPYRAHKRASESKDPADAKRYVHTTVLLDGHIRSSHQLLTRLPNALQNVTLYNTAVAYGTPPQAMASIYWRDGERIIECWDIVNVTKFFGIARLNSAATSKSALYRPDKKSHGFAYSVKQQVASLLDQLNRCYKSDNGYTMILQNQSHESYARISMIDGKPELIVTHSERFNLLMLTRYTEERAVAKELVLQTSAHADKTHYLGRAATLKLAIQDIQYDTSATPHRATAIEP
ncbi:MAG: hypothetical protein P1U40_03345 [Coxiellaceae bacterium]|nr:hypothetical protein [Coxiellaceae bacterium]